MRNYLVRLKNKNAFLYYIWSLMQYKKGVKSLKKYSDEEAIVALYETYSGKKPNLISPRTFSEKLQWLKLNNHNPEQTICADKFLVRDFITEKGYGHLLSNVLKVYEDINDFDLNKLPNSFVLKATHGSGWNIICENKKNINWFWYKKTMNIWLQNNIFWPGREWPYKDMKPRLIVEELLQDKSGSLMDYKFFCFHNNVKYIQANKWRETNNHAQNFYNLDWEIQPFGKDLPPRPDIKIDPPINLIEMKNIAEDLSKGFPFVRIDFYEVNGKIIFGEMTFYPKSGLPDFTPKEYDQILGEFLQIN